jgi:hypothetical protein
MSELPERIWAYRYNDDDRSWASRMPEALNGYAPYDNSEYIKIGKFTDRESLREVLLDGSMPMIASKMSKSGEAEAVEYVPLESVLDAILRLIGSTEKKKIK